MEIKINKEIRDYTEKIYFGLTLRQLIFSILACGVAVCIYFLLKDKFTIGTLSWLCILGAFPFAALGFITDNGMNAEEFIMAFLKSKLLSSKKLVFEPTNFYYELINTKKEEKSENIKKNSKTRQRKI